MKVLKFGGSSIGSAQRMLGLLNIIEAEENQIVVLSAVSGTTNALLEISVHYKNNDYSAARNRLEALRQEYRRYTKELLPQAEHEAPLNKIVDDLLYTLLAEEHYTDQIGKIIVAQGELISTHIFSYLLKVKGIAASELPALAFMTIREEEPQMDAIEAGIKKLLAGLPNISLFVTQGFICRNEHGEVDNLKRGGSDYTASLIGAVLDAEEIQIWTDIDGMHNSDPRIVGGTRPVAEITFVEAAELAYFGAKVLHPQSVLPAQKRNVPVRVLNTLNPQAKGTLISNKGTAGELKSIAAKDGIVAVNIRSSRMLLAYGFLRKVFEVFERYKVPIDMITTSEVAISLTIENEEHLPSIINELADYGNVTIDRAHTIVCVVGDFPPERSAIVSKIFSLVAGIPIRMISYGGSRNNLSLLVPSEFKTETLQRLHTGLFL